MDAGGRRPGWRRTRARRRWIGGAAALLVLACLAIPAVGAQTKAVTVDPDATAAATGFTDLDALTYEQAEARLAAQDTITLPLAIDGFERLGVSDVELESNDAGRSLALSGSAGLPALHGGDQAVELLITAVWADAESTEPSIAIAAKTADLSLTEVNPLWDDSYGEVSFSSARLAVANRDHALDPAGLPANAQDFYAEAVELTGGVNFAGEVALEGRLAEAFGYAGHSGEVALEGSLGASAAALFGSAGDAQLGALELTATLGKAADAPEWIADRTSTFTFTLEPQDGGGHRPGLRLAEDVTLAIDGTTNRFTGSLEIAPSGAIAAEIALVGPLDAPFGLDGLDPSKLSDVALRLARADGVTEGGLQLGVAVEEGQDPVLVLAGFSTGGGSTTVDFSIEGSIGVPALVGFAGELLGTEVTAVPGADGVSLDEVSFSFTTGAGARTFSVGARATVKQLQASAVLTLRKEGAEPAQPLLGLKLTDPGCDSDCIRMSSLLPAEDAGEILAGLRLPALNLTVAPPSLTELAAEDLTAQERAFFGETYEELPEILAFEAGVNLQGRLPVDTLGEDVRGALGYPAGSEVLLSGTLGAGATLDGLDGGSGVSLSSLELEAVLPAATESTLLPDWIEQTTPTTLAFGYAAGQVRVSFDTGAEVTVDGDTFATTISGAYEKAGARSSIDFRGTIADWQQPFGVTWIDSIDEATVAIDTSFGGVQPSTVEASLTAGTELGGKDFELEFALSKATSSSATLTARFADSAPLSEIVGLFPELSQAATDVGANGALEALSVGPVSASVRVGGAASAFELAARTTFTSGASTNVVSDLLIAARPGGAFSFGLKARGALALDDLVADAPSVDVELPGAALVLGSEAGFRPVVDLTDGEFDFYKTLHGCAADAERGECTSFARLELTRGLKLLAAFDLGEDVQEMASEIGIQTSGSALLTGSIPVFGGTDFALSASLGNFRFAQQPDWYERGDVALEIGTAGLKFAGRLGVKIQREGDQWMPDCEGGVVRYPFGDFEGRCYDLLTFEVSVRLALQPSPSLTLLGKLEADSAWKNAFGEEWLEIRRVALQLGVTLPPSGPEVTMGFQGDIKVGSKDIAAALKIGLAPLPGPPFVRPNLIGFSAASKAGLALSDVVWLNNQITGDALQIDTQTMPDVSLRNLFFQYSQQTDVDLCLTQGVRFNADLYVGTNLPGAGGEDDAGGCRTIDTSPETRESCHDRAGDGCLASVYGRFDSGGLEAGGEISAFELGPIEMQDSLVELALTPSRQRIRMKGEARIGSSSYEFARGKADLDFSRDGFDFKGDAAMFDDSFHGYVELAAPFDFASPSFRAKAWLRADARSAMNGLVGEKAEKVRPVIVGFGRLLQALTGNGSVANVRDLPSLLENAGATVPSEVRTMTTALGDAQEQIQRHAGPVLTLQPLLTGVSFNVPGIPGFYTPRTCITTVKDGRCWTTPPWGLIPGIPGVWVPSACVTTERDGACWTTPPFGVSVPGICSRLGIASSSPDCSWNGLMRRYVQPALLEAMEEATGIEFSSADFETAITTLVDRFADGAGSIVNVDCAYFSADATGLAAGNVDVDIATRVRLFEHPLEFGTSWDFRVGGGSPDEVLASIFRSIFSPSATRCPALPSGREEPGDEVPSRKLTGALTPSTANEGSEVTFSGTFEREAADYPAVTVDWGDGTSATIPAGTAQSVSARHSYPDDGPSGLAEASYAVSAVVGDAGAHTVQLAAVVRNVAPSFGSLKIEPAVADEHDSVTLRGAFADPGTPDSHEVRVDWGDGSEPALHRIASGGRSFALEHRYLDDPDEGESYAVTAVLVDDDTGSATRGAAAVVRNVAPSNIRVTPLEIVAAEGVESGDELVEVTEGAIVTYGIDFDDPGTRDAHTVTVDWGDGSEPQTIELAAGARQVELPHRFVDDGTFDVDVRVADDDGASAGATTPLEVANVAPSVAATLDRSSLDEGGSVQLEGSISDPGVLDSHTVTIDWGAGRSTADRYETVPVAAEDRTFRTEKPFGDDGEFTIGVEVEDDDGGSGTAALALAVANLAPTAAIDGAGSVAAPGGRTVVAREGRPVDLRARLTDAGSDDLASVWTWRDATAATNGTFLAAGPAADPDPSPQVGPRSVTDAVTHTWTRPCLYEDVSVAVADDDGGTAGDRIDVVVTGTASHVEGAGTWQREYDPRKAPKLPLDRLGCYLATVGQMSAVFGEVRGAGTRAEAYDVVNPGGGRNTEHDKLDRELLTAWLNFAHGGLRYGTISATLGDAEAVRLAPGATDDQLRRARQAVQRLPG